MVEKYEHNFVIYKLIMFFDKIIYRNQFEKL